MPRAVTRYIFQSWDRLRWGTTVNGRGCGPHQCGKASGVPHIEHRRAEWYNERPGRSHVGNAGCADPLLGDSEMSPQVEAILQQIERLDEADRLTLEQRLQELAEDEWKRDAESARASARDRGLNQQSIDEAVQRLRYGS